MLMIIENVIELDKTFHIYRTSQDVVELDKTYCVKYLALHAILMKQTPNPNPNPSSKNTNERTHLEPSRLPRNCPV